ncbi:SMC-Scp complex subunit ScpB [Klenkia terrae]|uniref:SMC-Scp complex subunit ScpB n=1 Tax=Klenkia terrae TaxID=1052259 RepID=A0ABU8E5E9_9ACTN|nr:SMC-Scp complex subunit ScpB [Klenkia terrae]
MSDEPRRPISWDQLAAELAAVEEAEGAAEEPAPKDWDAVAAALARTFDPPVPAPAPAPAPLTPVGWPADPEPATRHTEVQEDDVPLRPLDEVLVEEAAPEPADEPDDEEPVADPVALRGGLEALLFVVDSPVDEVTLAEALRCTVGQVRSALTALGGDYDDRRAGVVLRRVGEGWRLYTREEHAAVVERHLLEGQRSRLTQAALETLAVIAYRQPVTRARVSAIRGVGVDAVVRTLASRGLVYECGTDPDSGGGLYATTPLFLERLGLTGLDELPELGPLLPETRAVIAERPQA